MKRFAGRVVGALGLLVTAGFLSLWPGEAQSRSPDDLTGTWDVSYKTTLTDCGGTKVGTSSSDVWTITYDDDTIYAKSSSSSSSNNFMGQSPVGSALLMTRYKQINDLLLGKYKKVDGSVLYDLTVGSSGTVITGRVITARDRGSDGLCITEQQVTMTKE